MLLPQNYQPPPDLMPPRGTVVGPDGNLVAVGPPYINPNPSLADPNPPLPAVDDAVASGAGNRESRESATASTGAVTPVAPVAPRRADLARAVRRRPRRCPRKLRCPQKPAPASFGGNVGPSVVIRSAIQLSVITGQPSHRRDAAAARAGGTRDDSVAR